MYMVFRRLLVCLLWLWLPVSQAADSGWHRAGYRLAHAAGGELALADAAALRRRGHFHSGLSRRRQLSDDAAREDTADA